MAEPLESGNVTSLSPQERRRSLRIVEAVLFASAEPVAAEALAARLPPGSDVAGLLRELQHAYAGRGVNLVAVAGRWAFRTAEDLAFLLSAERVEERKLSRPALETLAIIAYHQPVTRAEIEEIRGVSASKGTLDVLLETGWVRMRGRRRTPGRPVTYGTTEAFLTQFGLDAVGDLPGLEELKGAGLLDATPPGFRVPVPRDTVALDADEEPLDEADAATDMVEE
jgi:segregation and condensation protein B